MADRPRIPADISREVFVEAGHRCAACGESIPLERAHIIPWHKSKEHKAEDLVCLCANCHARADAEKWGEKTLREYKQRPWVSRRLAKADAPSEPTEEPMDGEELQVYCNSCQRHTTHVVRGSDSTRYPTTPDVPFDLAQVVAALIQCRGCKEYALHVYAETDLDWNPGTREMEGTTHIYPRRQEKDLPCRGFPEAPKRLQELYRETVCAFNRGLLTLCAAGVRALIEGICADKGVRGGHVEQDGKLKYRANLDGKIEGLHQDKVLSEEHAQRLHSHRLLGNEALHELAEPSAEELKLSIEIAEHTLQNIYVLSSQGEQLSAQRNARRSQPKSYSRTDS